MEMSIALQVALFLAALAIIVLVACIIPVAFQTRRTTEKIARCLDEFKSDTHHMKQHTEDLIENLNELSRRANHQMDDVGQIVRTTREWFDRADRIVEQVEVPVFTLARNLNVLRAGVGKFMQVFLHGNHHKQTQEETEHE